MGIVSLPSIPSYWHTSWPFLNDGFRKEMSHDRFFLLLKFLHLSDNDKYISYGQAGHDRLYKIRPIITHLIAQFKSSYTPNQNCSVDESIISYKGRLSFLQYLPKKPHEWGIKAWVLADAKSGYMWNLDIYTGRSDERDGKLPLSSHVVLSLAADLLGKEYNFFDNFYTSPDLCKRLYENGSGRCGTVRLNRKGIPDWFKRKHVEKGEVITYRDGCILVIKWMDKRVVAALSTIDDDSMVEIQRRTSACQEEIETIQKPAIIHNYNTYMGGVDKADQLVTYYGFPHFSKKWWKRIFFHILDTTLVNAYIMYVESTPGHCLSHWLEVVRALINEQSTVCSVSATPQDVPLRLTGRHIPVPSIKGTVKSAAGESPEKESKPASNVMYVTFIYAYTYVSKSTIHSKA